MEQARFSGYPRRGEAALAIAQVAALLTLTYPGLIAEKVFEGTVSDPHTVAFQPEGPFTLSTPQTVDPDVLSSAFQERMAIVEALNPPEQSRFQLCARWLLRGFEARNPVDQFLNWFIALEVYPAGGKTKVVAAVRTLLATRVYPDLAPSLVSERLSLGRIHGVRSKIVHEGLSHVDLPLDPEFNDALTKLEAICTVCLRLLAGLAPGNDLDRWVRA